MKSYCVEVYEAEKIANDMFFFVVKSVGKILKEQFDI